MAKRVHTRLPGASAGERDPIGIAASDIVPVAPPLRASRLIAVRAAVGRAFINRNYALFMAGAFVSATGSWAQSVALGWLVLELGDSEFLLGLTNFAQMVPLLLLSIPAGALVDRFSHKRLLLVAQTGTMLSSAVLATATILGVRSIPLILITAVTSGLFNAIGWPTWSVFIHDLVGPAHLRSAVALNSARFNLTRVIGPAVAGVLLASYGAGVCLAIAAVSALGVIGAVLAIRLPPFEPGPARPWLASLQEGLRYCWNAAPVRRLLLVTAAVGFLAMPYQTFLPAFARDVLGRGPQALGLLLTSVGLGAIMGAALSGSRLAARRVQSTMMALMVGAGLSLVVLSFSRRLELSMLTLAVTGLSSIGYLAMANATLQLTCPQALLGRVMGVWTVVNAGMTPVGSLTIGAVAEQLGLTTALAGAGTLCALLAITVGWRGRRRLNSLPPA
ncbi:MAG: MFS transporter [Anaerolineae bacterium]|nr:MFS transporter [Anaerolineae bacterium]